MGSSGVLKAVRKERQWQEKNKGGTHRWGDAGMGTCTQRTLLSKFITQEAAEARKESWWDAGRVGYCQSRQGKGGIKWKEGRG